MARKLIDIFIKPVIILSLAVIGFCLFSITLTPRAHAGPATSCTPTVGSFGTGMRVFVMVLDHNGNSLGHARNYSFRVTVEDDGSGNYNNRWGAGNIPGLGRHYAPYWGNPEERFGAKTYTMNDTNRRDCTYGQPYYPYIFDSLVGTDLDFLDCLYNPSWGIYGATFRFTGVSVDDAGWGGGSFTQEQILTKSSYGPNPGDMNNNQYQTTLFYQLPPPSYNFSGYRIDRFGNAAPQFHDAGSAYTRMNTPAPGLASNSNPYSWTGINAAQEHNFTADSTTDWNAVGWAVNYNNTGWGFNNNMSQFTISANGLSNGTTVDSRFFYEPKHASVRAGVKVRDNPSGGIYSPCGSGNYSQAICGTVGLNISQLGGSGAYSWPATWPPAHRPGTQNASLYGNFVNSYTLDTSTTPSNPNSESNVGSLYYGYHRFTVPSVPAGFKIVGWRVRGAWNGSTASSLDVYINPNEQNVSVEPVLEPQTITLRGAKRGPGTFINQNSAISDIYNGTVTVNGSQLSGNVWGQNTYSTTLRYNPSSGNNSINVAAATGWQIRGYSFCTGTPTAPNCHNDAVQAPNNATSGSIILVNNGDGGDSLNLNIDYSTPTPTINGVALGSDVWLNVYLKPKPIDVQVKAWINQQGGSNSNKINPCDQSDYKKQICDDSRIRAVRMNTATWQGNIANTNPNIKDYEGPAGAWGRCVSTDYIPTKPGYNYTNFGNYYCALKDTGGTTEAGGTSNFAGDGREIRYGQTLDVATNITTDNANANESNAAIFRNVYPGKYSFQADGTPHNGGTAGWSGSGCPTGGASCSDNPLVSTVAIGVSGFPELAYDVGQSTCDINTTGCQDTKTVINDSGGCKLDHARRAALHNGFWWVININGAWGQRDSHGEDKCTIYWGGSAGDNYYGSQEVWNPSHNWNAAQPSRCIANYENWWPLGKGVYGETACGYYKWATKSVYTYSMGIVPDNAVGGIGQFGKALREQNFIYTPKFKLTQGTITCDTYTAKLAFMPDPSHPVDSYFRIANSNLMGSDNQPIIVSTAGTGPNPHDVLLNIPKYNGSATSSNTSPTLLKDGLTRNFEHFARFGSADPALVNGYSASAAEWSTGGYKYTPTRVFNGNHNCKNIAICDDADFDSQLSQYSVIDADDLDPITLNVRMTNVGESYWMRGVDENTYNNGGSRTTNHQLIVTGATISATSHSDTRAWVIGEEEMRMPDGSHVYPATAPPSGGNDVVTFVITPEPPTDGGSKFVIGFRMAQDPDGIGWQPLTVFDPNLGSVACEGDLEIKVSYKPWLRVQNGNVTALGKIVDQSERSRGVYKSETSSNTPYKGSVEKINSATPPGTNAKPDLNLHAQFSVAAEEGGENFCSTNFYMLGIANPPNSFTPNAPQQNRNCNFGGMELNIELTEDENNDGRKELNNDSIYGQVDNHFSTPGSTEAYGQCEDTQNGEIEDGLSGPYELSQAFKYYRSWWPGSASNAQNLVWSNVDGPTTFGGVSDLDGPFGKSGTAFNLVNTASPNVRPCPTVFQLTTSAAAGSNPDLPEQHRPLGGFAVASGRSTILSDNTVYITNNIYTDLNGTYKFQRGDGSIAPDIAGLNSLPNLGIIADGDIVIASNVDEIDASLYATGKIITCDKYSLEPGMNEDGSKTDKAGTTGSKWIRHGSTSTDANPLKNEIDDPNVVEPPTADNDTAKACSSNLKITGSVTAGTSFKFGRNYIDFAGMVTKWGDAEANAFGLHGKFCNKSTTTPAAYFQRACTVLGARRDFDSPEGWGANYLLEYKSGHPQNYYTGGPAEDFIGNGLASFIPPPGFENLNGSLQSAKYVNNSAKPQF